jgi:hypothetical protein
LLFYLCTCEKPIDEEHERWQHNRSMVATQLLLLGKYYTAIYPGYFSWRKIYLVKEHLIFGLFAETVSKRTYLWKRSVVYLTYAQCIYPSTLFHSYSHYNHKTMHTSYSPLKNNHFKEKKIVSYFPWCVLIIQPSVLLIYIALLFTILVKTRTHQNKVNILVFSCLLQREKSYFLENVYIYIHIYRYMYVYI